MLRPRILVIINNHELISHLVKKYGVRYYESNEGYLLDLWSEDEGSIYLLPEELLHFSLFLAFPKKTDENHIFTICDYAGQNNKVESLCQKVGTKLGAELVVVDINNKPILLEIIQEYSKVKISVTNFQVNKNLKRGEVELKIKTICSNGGKEFDLALRGIHNQFHRKIKELYNKSKRYSMATV